MSLDYNSLLLAVGFSAACLSLTLFGIWLTARSDKFLLTWAVSVLLIVGDVFAYEAYIRTPGRMLGLATFALLLIGFAMAWLTMPAVSMGQLTMTTGPCLMGYNPKRAISKGAGSLRASSGSRAPRSTGSGR